MKNKREEFPDSGEDDEFDDAEFVETTTKGDCLDVENMLQDEIESGKLETAAHFVTCSETSPIRKNSGTIISFDDVLLYNEEKKKKKNPKKDEIMRKARATCARNLLLYRMNEMYLLLQMANLSQLNRLQFHQSLKKNMLTIIPKRFHHNLDEWKYDLKKEFIDDLFNWYDKYYSLNYLTNLENRRICPFTSRTITSEILSMWMNKKSVMTSQQSISILFLFILRILKIPSRLVVAVENVHQLINLPAISHTKRSSKSLKESSRTKKPRKVSKGKENLNLSFSECSIDDDVNDENKKKGRKKKNLIRSGKKDEKKKEEDIVEMEHYPLFWVEVLSLMDFNEDELIIDKHRPIDLQIEKDLDREHKKNQWYVKKGLKSITNDKQMTIRWRKVLLSEYTRMSPILLAILSIDHHSNLNEITLKYMTGERYISEIMKLKMSSSEIRTLHGTASGFDDVRRERHPSEMAGLCADLGLMKQNLYKVKMPKTIIGFKNHPVYCLERHLLKFQGIHSLVENNREGVAGRLNQNVIYYRSGVVTLYSKQTWLKYAMQVKENEHPSKIVKGRPSYKECAAGVKFVDLELFGYWQIEPYIPPTAIDGKVPRNQYGNVDLFQERMLPIGTFHLKASVIPPRNVTMICRKLRIDHASAIYGFDLKRGYTIALTDGYVVCNDKVEIILKEYEAMKKEKERVAEENRLKTIYGRWRMFIKKMIIKDNLRRLCEDN
ncbi:hypothetical protein SNEBB_007147 [Seison nebaliae]|nr:hypothetical protein SNEBB_007147 [Seison nebaliae]